MTYESSHLKLSVFFEVIKALGLHLSVKVGLVSGLILIGINLSLIIFLYIAPKYLLVC